VAQHVDPEFKPSTIIVIIIIIQMDNLQETWKVNTKGMVPYGRA
jgi:hypothetical protein